MNITVRLSQKDTQLIEELAKLATTTVQNYVTEIVETRICELRRETLKMREAHAKESR